jgi:YidC/Oxa1 family membrane protein insertase
MDLFSFPPIAATLDAAYAALMGVAALLQPLAGTASAAVAVVLVTLLVRAILIPTGVAQAKAEQTRARIAPRLLALQRRHKNDRERLQRETMKLYADEKASPFAGCLPILIQAPIVGVIYALFLHTAIAGHSNDLLTEQLFGVPLGSSLIARVGDGGFTLAAGMVFVILIAAIAGVAEITRRVLRPQPAEPSVAGSAGALRLVGLLQFATAVVAVFVPLAAGLYLLVTVAWTLAQRLILRRIYPLAGPTTEPPRGGQGRGRR